MAAIHRVKMVVVKGYSWTFVFKNKSFKQKKVHSKPLKSSLPFSATSSMLCIAVCLTLIYVNI